MQKTVDSLFLVIVGILFGVLLMLFVDLAAPLPADAACGSMPYVFVNNVSTLDALSTNANNSFLLGCATSVDNTQIGSSGIFASQIVPSSQSTATFNGGNFGWRITVGSAGLTPLTIVQPTSPTADALAVYNNALSTKYVWVDSGGVLHTNQAPIFNGVTFSPSGFVDTVSAQSVGGVKTFTSAPVMSGASITSATIPLAALATAPITSVTASGNLSSSGGTTPAITMTNSPTWTGTATASAFTSTQGYGASGYDVVFNSGTSSGATGIGVGSSWSVQSVTCSEFGIISYTVSVDTCMDTGGNWGIRGNVTASNVFLTSKRSAKTDIHLLQLDALNILRNTCWSRWHYKPKYGDPSEEHIGFIADCTPDTLSGPYHDHFDVPAVATVDALAILQLEKRLDGLDRMVRGLCKLPQNRKAKVCSSVR